MPCLPASHRVQEVTSMPVTLTDTSLMNPFPSQPVRIHRSSHIIAPPSTVKSRRGTSLSVNVYSRSFLFPVLLIYPFPKIQYPNKTQVQNLSSSRPCSLTAWLTSIENTLCKTQREKVHCHHKRNQALLICSPCTQSDPSHPVKLSHQLCHALTDRRCI